MMTDFTQMIRWNANFVRGLAESVLNRAKVIRSSLTSASETPKSARKVKAKKAALKSKPAIKRPGKRAKRTHA